MGMVECEGHHQGARDVTGARGTPSGSKGHHRGARDATGARGTPSGWPWETPFHSLCLLFPLPGSRFFNKEQEWHKAAVPKATRAPKNPPAHGSAAGVLQRRRNKDHLLDTGTEMLPPAVGQQRYGTAF